MSNTVTRDEAEQYSFIREKSPESLYRSGTREKVPGGEPTGRDFLVAHLATELAQELTNAGLAILGESGVLRVADSLVEELDQETNLIKAVENRGGRSQSPVHLGNLVLGRFRKGQIRAAVATDLARRKRDESREPDQVLRNTLGDARLFRSEFASSRSNPQSARGRPNGALAGVEVEDSVEIEGNPVMT